jgi:hypothetical protein
MAIKFWTYSNKFVVEAPKFGFDAEDAEFYRKEILWIGVAGSVVSYFIIRTICNSRFAGNMALTRKQTVRVCYCFR